jgi:rhomboid protease GluP
MTFTIQVLNWGVYFWMRYYEEAINCGDGTDFYSWVMFKFQAQSNYEVLYEWQWHRLLTAGYVHANFDHIFGNMTSIYFTSIILEWQIGPYQVFNIYNFTNFTGNVASAIAFPDSLGMGASTAVYAFYGAMAGNVLKQRYGMRSETNLVFLVPVAYWAVNIFIDNLSGQGDIVAHGSGWFQGLFYIILLLPNVEFQGGWLSKTYYQMVYNGAIVCLVVSNLLKLIYFILAV